MPVTAAAAEIGYRPLTRGSLITLIFPTMRHYLCDTISIDNRSRENTTLRRPRSRAKRNSNSGQRRRSGAID